MSYSGLMDGQYFSHDRPYVVFGATDTDAIISFEAFAEAVGWIRKQYLKNPYVAFAHIYGFSQDKWIEIPYTIDQ